MLLTVYQCLVPLVTTLSMLVCLGYFFPSVYWLSPIAKLSNNTNMEN